MSTSMLPQKILETPAGASVDPVLPTSNGVRDIDYKYQVLNLKYLTWSKVDTKMASEIPDFEGFIFIFNLFGKGTKEG